MTVKKYNNLTEFKKAYLRGENITRLLKKLNKKTYNTSDAIEISYDLQSGSYNKLAENNKEISSKYAEELFSIIKNNIKDSDNILDCGTGEMTNYSAVMKNLDFKKGFNFDLSLSRVLTGINLLDKNFKYLKQKTTSFVASMDAIPLPNNSIDLIWTSHSLEPNGGKEEILIKEMLRVCKRKMILFEPSYKRNCEQGKERMKKLGYICELEDIINKTDSKLLEIKKINSTVNPINPTYAYIIQKETKDVITQDPFLTTPGGDLELNIDRNDSLLSSDALIGFPKVKGIPLLRDDKFFIMTHPDLLA